MNLPINGWIALKVSLIAISGLLASSRLVVGERMIEVQALHMEFMADMHGKQTLFALAFFNCLSMGGVLPFLFVLFSPSILKREDLPLRIPSFRTPLFESSVGSFLSWMHLSSYGLIAYGIGTIVREAFGRPRILDYSGVIFVLMGLSSAFIIWRLPRWFPDRFARSQEVISNMCA